MQTQRTKTVVARQLSQKELNNYFFPRPYPLWAWGLAVVGPLLIGSGLASQLWLMSIAGLPMFLIGLLSLLSIKHGNPDDGLYDAWVENQGQLLAQKGFQRLDITRSQMSDRLLNIRSYVLPGSIDAADYDENAVRIKRGKDGGLRFSINIYTYIYPLKDALAIFKCDINALDPGFQNDQDEIYPYHLLAGVSMTSNPRDRIVIGGQKYPYRIEQFGLMFNNGRTIPFSATVRARPPGSMSGVAPIIRLPDTGFNRTYNILRKILLSKQFGR